MKTESMEEKTTRRRMDWQQFIITVLGTAIGVALTFVISGIINHRNKEQAQRLTAIMVIHDIDNTIGILETWKEQEEEGQALLQYALDHKDQKEPVPSDTMTSILTRLVRRKAEYHFDTSKEQIFNSDVDTWQNLGNMKFIDNVQRFFYERQSLLETASTEDWFREPIPDDEYMKVIMESGWVTQQEYDAQQWSFLRDQLNDKRVVYYINVAFARVSALNDYIDRFTHLNEENKFIMGITDQEMEDYVNSITNKGIALNRADLPGHWWLSSKDRSMEYDFHSDNSYTYTNENTSSYIKTRYWSGSYKLKVSYRGTWALQRDSLIMKPDYSTSDVQVDPGDIVVEDNMKDTLATWLNSCQERTLDYMREQTANERYAVKALLDSSRDKMEWTESDGTVRYWKRR